MPSAFERVSGRSRRRLPARDAACAPAFLSLVASRASRSSPEQPPLPLPLRAPRLLPPRLPPRGTNRSPLEASFFSHRGGGGRGTGGNPGNAGNTSNAAGNPGNPGNAGGAGNAGSAGNPSSVNCVPVTAGCYPVVVPTNGQITISWNAQ